jgi:competence protein ComEA
MDAPNPAPSQPNPAAWPRSAQLTTAFLLGTATALLIVQLSTSWRRGRPTDFDPERLRVDLNSARHADLLQVPGVGERLATRIENARRDQGRLRSANDLKSVAGLGSKTTAQLRPWIDFDVDEGNEADEPPLPLALSKPVGKKEAELSALIDVNRARLADLQRLPGIGPRMAQRLIDERDKRLFQSVDDLRRVSGIGVKTLAKLRPYVTVGGNREEPVDTNSQVTTHNDRSTNQRP